MAKVIFTSTWTSCWKIIRIIPFLADSGAFVTGVWAVLRHFQMSWEIGVAIVVLALVGIGAIVNRLERAKSLNQNAEPTSENNSAPQSSRQASKVLKRGQLHTAAPANQENSPVASNHSLKFKIAMGKLRIEIISTRVVVRDNHRRKSIGK